MVVVSPDSCFVGYKEEDRAGIIADMLEMRGEMAQTALENPITPDYESLAIALDQRLKQLLSQGAQYADVSNFGAYMLDEYATTLEEGGVNYVMDHVRDSAIGREMLDYCDKNRIPMSFLQQARLWAGGPAQDYVDEVFQEICLNVACLLTEEEVATYFGGRDIALSVDRPSTKPRVTYYSEFGAIFVQGTHTSRADAFAPKFVEANSVTF